MEDEGMMKDAPRKTQLWRVDHNSTFYFKRTPSPTSSSPTGSSVRRQRISLRFCTTSNREWWDTTDDEREDSEHLGLVATAAEGGENLADGLQRFDNAAERNAGTVGKDAAGIVPGGGGWFVRDYAKDVAEEAFDQGDESVEAAGDDLENDEHHGVRQPTEVVSSLRLLLLLLRRIHSPQPRSEVRNRRRWTTSDGNPVDRHGSSDWIGRETGGRWPATTHLHQPRKKPTLGRTAIERRSNPSTLPLTLKWQRIGNDCTNFKERHFLG
ncbi:hypothetical protein MUK42_35775 [Musa troglodytarum]|uniref:Uncharacterized protein n=1 Tax=Musa troglodytarum TaxID=320322 RepID=A0A9E7GC82_9LILI|nr:hypothetical protein MUK42_35775 [Musa troglodytarum]